LVNADILLFTSTTEGEGMPGVLIEAGLAGLPAIATDVPGARAVIEEGISGFVVPVNDFEALVEASERLANDPELRKLMGVAARQKCVREFTLDSSVHLWRAHFQALAGDVTS
jgi:glycosyltransferase involved in cell wall biosynthesis